MTTPADTASAAFTEVERWESVKGAIAGGITAGGVSLGILAGRHGLALASGSMVPLTFSGLAGQALLVNVAIAAVSGALFALTYRYAIRQDQNPQLKAGVVFAFTLVRGLAQVDAGSAIAQNLWPFVSACLESGLLFGTIALLLAWGFRAGWLRPFGSTAKGDGYSSLIDSA